MAGGAARVHTRGGRAGRNSMRCALRGVAGPGKGARRALCRACVCKRGAGVQTRGVRGARGPRRGEGALRASVRRALGAAGCVLTPAPAPAPAPALAPGSRPVSRSAHAQAPSLAVARNATPAVSPGARLRGARRGPGARRGRGGGLELRRSPGSLPGARRALPRAGPPARSLFNLK